MPLLLSMLGGRLLLDGRQRDARARRRLILRTKRLRRDQAHQSYATSLITNQKELRYALLNFSKTNPMLSIKIKPSKRCYLGTQLRDWQGKEGLKSFYKKRKRRHIRTSIGQSVYIDQSLDEHKHISASYGLENLFIKGI